MRRNPQLYFQAPDHLRGQFLHHVNDRGSNSSKEVADHGNGPVACALAGERMEACEIIVLFTGMVGWPGRVRCDIVSICWWLHEEKIGLPEPPERSSREREEAQRKISPDKKQLREEEEVPEVPQKRDSEVPKR